jgi:hypothetical protein
MQQDGAAFAFGDAESAGIAAAMSGTGVTVAMTSGAGVRNFA